MGSDAPLSEDLIMAPYALCTNPFCGFVFDFLEEHLADGVPSRVPPDQCPRCGRSLLIHCPVCFAQIARIPTRRRSFCNYCGYRLHPRVTRLSGPWTRSA
jgi:hypothetical protein